MPSRITVSVDGESGGLQAAVDRAAAALQGLSTELRKQTDQAVRAGERSVASNDRVASSFEKASRSATSSSRTMATRYSASADEQVRAADRVIASLDRAATAAVRSSEEQATAANRLTAALDRAAVAAERSARRQSMAADGAGRAAARSAAQSTAAAERTRAAFGRSDSAITKSGRNITAGLVGVGAASAYMAVKFQANTTRLQTQAGASAKQVDLLRKGLLKMAPEVGYLPNQLADGMYHVVGSMNKVLPPAQRVGAELHIMRIAAEGAQIGGSNLEETTYALASAMNALHEPGSAAGRVMGELNSVVGTGDMTMQDLVDEFKSGVVPAAKQAGVSLQSLGAASAVLGDEGIRGSMAGTRLRMTIALLSAPSMAAAKVLNTIGLNAHEATSRSEAMADALKKAGLRTTSLSADLHKPDGIIVAIRDLNSHLRSSGLTASGAAAVMNKAFGGARSGSTITALAQNTRRLDESFKQVGRGAKNFGKDWNSTRGTLQVQLKQLKAGAASLGTELGDALIPKIEHGIRDLKDMVHWFQQNHAAVKALEGIVGTFAAVTIGSYFVSKVRDAIKLMRELRSLATMPLKAAGWLSGSTAAKGRDSMSRAASGSFGIGGARTGPGLPGSPENPLVVTMEGGNGNLSKGASTAETAAKDAERAAGAEGSGAGVARLGAGRLAGGTAAAAGLAISGFAEANRSGDSPVGKLKGFARGADPSQVLHMFGLPDASDVTLGVKTDQEALRKAVAVSTTMSYGWKTSLKGIGDAVPHHQLNQFALDIDRANTELGYFLSKDQTVSQSSSTAIKSFSNLASAAAKIGDVKYEFADRLAAELIKTRRVNSRGVQQLMGQWSQLPSAAQGSAAAAMLNMTNRLESGGKAATGTTDAMRRAIAASYDRMGGQVVADVGKMSTAIKGGSRSASQAASREMAGFASAVEGSMASGALSAGKGMQVIITNLNKALGEMGQKKLSQIQVATLSRSATNAGLLEEGKTPAGGFRETGGFIGASGERGRDTVPIVVGRGEAVLNHQQQRVVNHSLAETGVGSLSNVFQNTTGTRHYMASGGYAGGLPRLPGYAAGGMVTGGPHASYGQLEALWIRAGGPRNLAPLMAAIAEAESGGYDQMQQHEDFAHTGWGYWQITPGGAEFFDPMTNAKTAVSKWRSQGLSAWTTYTSGAYRQYLNGAVPAGLDGLGGVGAMFSPITAPRVSGTGAIHDIVKAAINKGVHAANAYGQAHQPAMSAVGVGGAGPPTIVADSGHPEQVQKAMFAAANRIVGLPYTYGGGHNSSFAGGPGYDCSGAVSYVLHAGGLLASPLSVSAGGGLETYGLPGPGRFITIAGRGSSGEGAHTMMSMFGRYFESGGAGGRGPHWDSGWDGSWDVFRHPPGFAAGGIVGDFGDVPPAVLLRTRPGMKSDATFKRYAQRHGAGRGGFTLTKRHGRPDGGGKFTKMVHLPHVKPPRRAGYVHAHKLKTLKAPTGFATAIFSRMNSLNNQASNLNNWLAYLTQLHGSYEAIVTQADGTQVVNWDGMVDPTTGVQVKGINQRLAEIGQPGTLDRNTELGVNDLMLADYQEIQKLAARAMPQYSSWWASMSADRFAWKHVTDFEQHEINWLDRMNKQAVPYSNVTVPGWEQLSYSYKLPHGHPRPKLQASPKGGSWYEWMAQYIQAIKIQRDQSTWLEDATHEDVAFSDIKIPTVPSPKTNPLLPTGPQGQPWYEWAAEELRKVKNALADKTETQAAQDRLQNGVGDDGVGSEANRLLAITNRYKAARHRISIAGMKKKFNATELMDQQSLEIDNLEHDELAALPTAKPKKWKGDDDSWQRALGGERDRIQKRYAARRASLRDGLGEKRLQGEISRSNALYALDLAEGNEKGALRSKYHSQMHDLAQQISGDDTTVSSVTKHVNSVVARKPRDGVKADTHYLSGAESDVKTLQSAGLKWLKQDTDALSDASTTLLPQLRDDLNPIGTLAVSNIDPIANINIPNLLAEISQLRGTKITPVTADGGGDTGSTETSAALALEQQLAQQIREGQALMASESSVLMGMLPLIPKYEKGGPIVRDTLAMVHEGEYVVPKGGALISTNTTAAAPEVHVHNHIHGDPTGLVRTIRSEIRDPRNVMAVSKMIGSRTRMLRR